MLLRRLALSWIARRIEEGKDQFSQWQNTGLLANLIGVNAITESQN
jgi:hypothetical protein